MPDPYLQEEEDPLTITRTPTPTGQVVAQGQLQTAPNSAPAPPASTPQQPIGDFAQRAPQPDAPDPYARQEAPEPVILHRRMVDPDQEQAVQARDQQRAAQQQRQDQAAADKQYANRIRGLKDAGVELDFDPETGESRPRTDAQGRMLYRPAVIEPFHQDPDSGEVSSIHRNVYGQTVKVPLRPVTDPSTGERMVTGADGVTKMSLGVDERFLAAKDLKQAGEVASIARRQTDDVRGQMRDLKAKAKDLTSKIDTLSLEDNPSVEQQIALKNARTDLQAAIAQQAALGGQHEQLAQQASVLHDEWMRKRQSVAALDQADYAKRNPGSAIALASGKLPVATTPPAALAPDAPPGFQDVTSSDAFKAAKEGDRENMLRKWVDAQVAYRAQTDPSWNAQKEKQFRGEHPDRPGVMGWVSELGHGIYSAIADQFPEDLAKIARGDNVSLHGNAWYDRVIDEQEADKLARGQSIQKSAGSEVSTALAQGPAAIPISLALGAVGSAIGKPIGGAVGALAGIETGPGAVATGAVGAAVGSGAVSGAAFYRMAKGDFLQQVRDKLVPNFDALGTPLTDAQWSTIKDSVEENAQKAGAWQAGPAALSQALTMGLFNGAGKALATKALGGIIGRESAESLARSAVLGVLAKYGGTAAEQVATMTATQQGLHNVESDAGLTDEPRRSFTSLADLQKSAGEIVGPVLVQALLQGGATHLVEAGKEHAADSKLASQWNKQNAGVEGYVPVTGKAAPAIRAAASLAMDDGMQKQWARHTEDVARAVKAVTDARETGDTAGADAAMTDLQAVQARQPAIEQALSERRAAATDAIAEAANAAPTDRVPLLAALKSAAGQELTRQEATALTQTRDAAGQPIATRDGANGVKMTDTAADTLRAKFPATAKLIDLSRPAVPAASTQQTPPTHANATNATPPPLPNAAERAATAGPVREQPAKAETDGQAEGQGQNEPIRQGSAAVPEGHPGPEPNVEPPPELAAAQPRYTFGGRQHSLHFASDVDKAAYLANHASYPAKRAVFARHAMDAGGMTAEEVAAHGGKVRDAINEQAAKPDAGPVLTVPDQQPTSARNTRSGPQEAPAVATSQTQPVSQPRKEPASPPRRSTVQQSGDEGPSGRNAQSERDQPQRPPDASGQKDREQVPSPKSQKEANKEAGGTSPHPAPAHPEPQADPMARTPIVYRSAQPASFTPEQRRAFDAVAAEFHRNRGLFRQFGIELPQYARAQGDASGIATSEGRLSVDPEKLIEHLAIVKQRAGGDASAGKRWVKEALIEEVVHQATIKGLGPKWVEKLQSAWNDPAMTKEMKDAAAAHAAQTYDGFENLDDHQKAAEVVRMVVQGRWKRTITEQVVNIIRDLHAYLTGLKVEHSPLLQEAIDRTRAALIEARKQERMERQEARNAAPAAESHPTPESLRTQTSEPSRQDQQSQPRSESQPESKTTESVPSSQRPSESRPAPGDSAEAERAGMESQSQIASPEPATPAAEAQAEPEKPEAVQPASDPLSLTESEARMVGQSSREPASWIIRNKETGEVMAETRQRSVAEKVNKAKYEAVPSERHMREMNDPSTPAHKWANRSTEDTLYAAKAKTATQKEAERLARLRETRAGFAAETGTAPKAAPQPHILTKPEGRSAINAYHHLARTTGFPAVSIADLADQSGVPLDRLKQQLLRSQKAGSVVLSTGDWSLASDKQRAGVIEDKGQKMLQVRFLNESGDLAAARAKSPAEKEALEELPKIAEKARARVAAKAAELRAEAERIRGELKGETSAWLGYEIGKLEQSRADRIRRAGTIAEKLRDLAINGPGRGEDFKQHVVAAIKRGNEPLPEGVTIQPLKSAYVSAYAGHNAELDALSWNDEADAKAELAARGYKGADADVLHKPFPNERYAAFRGDSLLRKDRLAGNADTKEEAAVKYHVKQASTDPAALQRYAEKYGINQGGPSERESALREELASIEQSNAEAVTKVAALRERIPALRAIEDRGSAVDQQADKTEGAAKRAGFHLAAPQETEGGIRRARATVAELEDSGHLTEPEAAKARGHLDELASGIQADDYLENEEDLPARLKADRMTAKQTASARDQAARIAEKSALWSALIEKKYGSVAGKLARFWKGVGSDDEAFAFPKSDARDPDLIAQQMSIPGHEMTAEEKSDQITFKTPQGELSITDTDSAPEIYAAIAGSKGKKQGGGSQLYQAALTWAHNNGKKIYPSNALTPINKFVRRTSNMLSSALRFGTTKHMVPDETQGVKWKKGNDSYNIGHLALREMEQVFKAVPDLQKLTFDFDTAKVLDERGSEVTPADLEQRLRDDKESSFDRGIGRSTAQRAIITASALRELESSQAAGDGGSLEGRGPRISDEQGSVLYAAKANTAPEKSAADRARAESAVSAFAKLTKEERTVVNMRLAGQTDEAIGKATGLSVAGVKRAYDSGLGRMSSLIKASTAVTSPQSLNRNTGVTTPKTPVTVDEAIALRRELGQEQKASQQGKRAGIAEARAEMLPKIAELRGKLSDSVTKASAYSEGLKQALRAGEVGRAAGTSDTREQLAQADRWLTGDMNRVKDDMVNFTNAMLPKEERGRFLPQIANALANRPGILNGDPTRPYRDAFKIMGRIQLKAEDVYRSRLQDEIKAAAAKALASKTVDIHFKDAIKALTDRHQFAELTDKKRAQLEARRETIANTPAGAVHGFTGEDIAELRRLVLPHISELPTGALEAMLGQIESLGAEGRGEVKGRKAAWEQDKSAAASALKGEQTTPFDKRALEPDLAPLKPGQKTEMTVGQRLQNTVRKVMDQAQVSLDRALMPVDALFDILGSAKGKYDGWLFRHVRNPLDLAHNERLFEEKQANDRLDAVIKKHGLTIGDSKRIAVFATDQQEGGRERLKAQGYTDARIDEITRTLTPGEREAYGEMRRTMDGELPHVQATMRDLYNIDVPGVKDYFPMPRDWKLMAESAERPKAASDPATGNLDELATWKNVVEDISAKNTTSVAKGMTKERVEGAKTAIKLDAFNTYRQHMADVLHLKHSQALLKSIGEIARTPLFADKYGKAGRQEVMDWLDTVARNGGVDAFRRLPLLDGLRKLSSVGMIAFRLSSTFKHASNAALAIPHVGATWYMRGLANVFSNDAQAFLGRHFAETVNRSGGEQAIEEVTRMSKIAGAGFYGIRKIDQIDAQAAVLGHYMRSLAAKGIDPASFASIPIDREAQGGALVRMRRVVASAAAKDTPQVLSRGRGLGGNVSVARSIFQFGNIFLDRWSNIRHDLVTGGVMKGETRQAALVTIGLLGAIAAESGIVMATHAVSNAITGQHDDPDDNSRDFEHETLKHSMRQIPYLSQLLQAAMYRETGIPAIDAPLGVAGEVGQAAKVADPNKKLLHVVKAAGQAAAVLGVPGAGQATDLVTGKMKVQGENAVQQLMRENSIHHNPEPKEGILPRKDLVKGIRDNTMTPGEAYRQARKGGMGEKDAMRLVKDAAEDPALSSFKRLPYQTARTVLQKASHDTNISPKLRQQLFDEFQKKRPPHAVVTN